MNKPTTVLTLQKNIDIFFQASYLKYLVNICLPHRSRFRCFSERVRFRNHTCESLRWRMPIEKIQFLLTEFKNLSCFDLIIHIKKRRMNKKFWVLFGRVTLPTERNETIFTSNITYLLNYNINNTDWENIYYIHRPTSWVLLLCYMNVNNIHK